MKPILFEKYMASAFGLYNCKSNVNLIMTIHVFQVYNTACTEWCICIVRVLTHSDEARREVHVLQQGVYQAYQFNDFHPPGNKIITSLHKRIDYFKEKCQISVKKYQILHLMKMLKM